MNGQKTSESKNIRLCKTCGIEKALDDFPVYKAKGTSGHRHQCRKCWNARWNVIVASHNSRYYHENTNGYRDRQKARTAKMHLKSRKKHQDRNRTYAKNHPEKIAAKVAVMIAVRSGKLTPLPCRVCGEKAQAHHDDYSLPLAVIWLCPLHHGERHRLLNRYGDPSEWPEDLRVQEMPR